MRFGSTTAQATAARVERGHPIGEKVVAMKKRNWAFFDDCVGPTNETIGTTVMEVGAAFGMPARWASSD